MSERALKEKTARRRTQESADPGVKDLEARGAGIKDALDEVEELIDEALEENGDLLPQKDLVALVEAFWPEQEDDETYDGERCPCGFPIADCWRSKPGSNFIRLARAAMNL